jgi:hypothetical protein
MCQDRRDHMTEGELAGGLKGTCVACPFNVAFTEEAAKVWNYGCLPDTPHIIQMKKTSGHNWACHSNENKVCAGLCHVAKDLGLNLSEGGLIRPSTWEIDGEEAALNEALQNARTRQPLPDERETAPRS